MAPVPGLTPDDVAQIAAYVRLEQRKAGIQQGHSPSLQKCRVAARPPTPATLAAGSLTPLPACASGLDKNAGARE